jgi:hypothetical protein
MIYYKEKDPDPTSLREALLCHPAFPLDDKIIQESEVNGPLAMRVRIWGLVKLYSEVS